MAKQGFFIAGTDTDAGKTLVACTLAEYFRKVGKRVAVAKPVAAGAEWQDGQLKNDDALALQRAAGGWQSYEHINPLCFEEAIAPHIAARGQALSVASISHALQPVVSEPADILLIEGAGGWYVPLNDSESLADLAVQLSLPVVLVVGIKLGCLNHALLSAEAILASGLPLVGWVGSVVDANMMALDDNVKALKARLPAPCWGVLPYTAEPVASRFIEQLHVPVSR